MGPQNASVLLLDSNLHREDSYGDARCKRLAEEKVLTLVL